jgi:hypothetical protein
MTPDQIERAKALAKCTFWPGSRDKRFMKAMAFRAEHDPGLELTEKQVKYMTDLIHKYRRQLAAKGFRFPEMEK